MEHPCKDIPVSCDRAGSCGRFCQGLHALSSMCCMLLYVAGSCQHTRCLHLPGQVEATKFTEVGFHGRDVDQIVRDLVDAAIVSTRAKLKRQLRRDIGAAVEEKILDSLLGTDGPATTRVRAGQSCLLAAMLQ